MKKTSFEKRNREVFSQFVSFINSIKGKAKLNYTKDSLYVHVIILEKLEVQTITFEECSFEFENEWFTWLNSVRKIEDQISQIMYNRQMMFYAKSFYPDVWESINWEFRNVLNRIDENSLMID